MAGLAGDLEAISVEDISDVTQLSLARSGDECALGRPGVAVGIS